MIQHNDTAAERWEYQKCQAFEATICTTWWLLNFVPPGVFERIAGNILRRLWARIDDSFAFTDNANRLQAIANTLLETRALLGIVIRGWYKSPHICSNIKQRFWRMCGFKGKEWSTMKNTLSCPPGETGYNYFFYNALVLNLIRYVLDVLLELSVDVENYFTREAESLHSVL